MVNKHKQKKKKNFKTYRKSNKVFNALMEKKFQKFVKYKKRRNTLKEVQHSQKIQISDDESKTKILSLAESVESGEISSSSSEWKMGSDELFVICLNENSEIKIAK